MAKAAFVVGFTGESGKELVKELIKCDAIQRLVLIGRREVQLEQGHQKVEQKVVDFESLDTHRAAFEGCDIGYCCLGTTRGKAGKEGFVKVDHDYVLSTARVAKETGCRHFHLLSSSGADKNSWFLFPKVKGQVEADVTDVGFERLCIYRPAVLMCDRQESRPGEAFVRALLKPWSAVSTSGNCRTTTLAQAMLNSALHDSGKAVELFNNSDVHKLAKKTYYGG